MARFYTVASIISEAIALALCPVYNLCSKSSCSRSDVRLLLSNCMLVCNTRSKRSFSCCQWRCHHRHSNTTLLRPSYCRRWCWKPVGSKVCASFSNATSVLGTCSASWHTSRCACCPSALYAERSLMRDAASGPNSILLTQSACSQVNIAARCPVQRQSVALWASNATQHVCTALEVS